MKEEGGVKKTSKGCDVSLVHYKIAKAKILYRWLKCYLGEKTGNSQIVKTYTYSA